MAKGVALSVFSSVLFALLYYYASLMTPMNGEVVFGWRMLLTMPCLGLFLLYSGDWRLVATLLSQLKRRPVLWLGLPLSSALVAVQLWIFMWAPINGRGLAVSLGYFMMPLVLVLVGRFLYHERPTRLQWLAVACAAVGVANELWHAGGLSWETLVVAIGYPLYFVWRRWLGNDNLGGLWCDMLLMLPAAAWLAFAAGSPMAVFAERPLLYPLVLGLGVISALALACYILASRRLPFSLFGLLGYVEPVLLVLVSLVLGETISAEEWPTYIAIWTAVALLVLEGVRKMLAFRRYPFSQNAAH
ncbi:transporter DMT superfamily protein [Oceanimonas sp. GK1]|uniref:EamA family transporter RarD n=1 Tax=Oceanimonas sp. (strain GK1 / IBRC-M 10197) TaxID=511062 RepID=UPI000249543E|nr:EamA family transporter RarD [Oceanimonas sp. GK1]AEY01518.1 transporter DMT superfamily protein [Oceanimonas sp. GK1]